MKTRLVVPAVAAVALVAGAAFFAAQTAEATDVGLLATGGMVHKAGQGFDYEVGSKHAVGYFTAKGSDCALTVIISDRVTDDGVAAQGARVRVNVAGGADALLETADGKGLQVSCASDAKHVTVTPLASGNI
ncbi:hypothetical protein [Chthonobacter albigriseus]|uniref:hypothetical protein n=1 Tax=Chthonobacter albigriseus TaxID=1683161 RepID=UPI0015EFC130|nr:hypothetical protein [Chthonobacter albigriseus]